MNLKLNQKLFYFDEEKIKIIVGEIISIQNNFDFVVKWQDKKDPIHFNTLSDWVYTNKQKLIRCLKISVNKKLQEDLAKCRHYRKILEYLE